MTADPAAPAARVAVIGDVSGHDEPFARMLTDLGADIDTGTLPADLTVVSVGDLVHRGPGSAQVVALVDRFRQHSPDQWIQLAGNHETQYFRAPAFIWNEELPEQTTRTLREWWDSGWMSLAHAVDTTGQSVRAPGGVRVDVGAGGLLITHAGLTSGRWSLLGCPATATETAAAINWDGRSRADDDWRGVWAPGVMLTRTPAVDAGVIWAASDSEVIRSWVHLVDQGYDLPGWHQAHGHSRPAWRARTGLAWSPVMRQIDSRQAARRFDVDTSITRVQVLPAGDGSLPDLMADAMTIWGTDPGHTAAAKPAWGPLLLGVRPPRLPDAD